MKYSNSGCWTQFFKIIKYFNKIYKLIFSLVDDCHLDYMGKKKKKHWYPVTTAGPIVNFILKFYFWLKYYI
jgi:hypothetical protein